MIPNCVGEVKKVRFFLFFEFTSRFIPFVPMPYFLIPWELD